MKPQLLILAIALGLGACVAAPPAPPSAQLARVSVEDQKKAIAEQRDRGLISYEEAARRQFAIQRANYPLTGGEVRFWQESITYARQVDRRQISPAEYRSLIQSAYRRNVG